MQNDIRYTVRMQGNIQTHRKHILNTHLRCILIVSAGRIQGVGKKGVGVAAE